MILQKREIQNYTADEVRAHVTDALNLTTELDPPSDLRAAVFNQAVGLLSGKQIIVEQMQQSPNGLQLGGLR